MRVHFRMLVTLVVCLSDVSLLPGRHRTSCNPINSSEPPPLDMAAPSTHRVSYFAQTPSQSARLGVAPAGPLGSKNENCADRAAYGERAASTLWWNRANCFLSHG